MSYKFRLLLALLLGTTAQAQVHIVVPVEKAIAVYGPIMQGSSEVFAAKLASIPDNSNVWLLIQGNGGMVSEGRSMINTLANARSRGILSHCIAVDYARSMHTFLWDHCDFRYAQPMTSVLWHKILWVPTAPIPMKTADLKTIMQGLENENRALYYPMSVRMKMAAAKFNELSDTDVTGLILYKLTRDYFKLIDSFELKSGG